MTDIPQERAILDGGRVVRLREAMVPMRDGVHLATDVYLPADDGRERTGPHPVLLERTPYDKRGVRAAEITAADRTPMRQHVLASHFARAGYAVVMQDCRGRYRSGGRFEKYVADAEDGFDTLDWIARQPWSNGRTATFGLSYCAHVQMALASLGPPTLAGMLLDSGGFSDAFQGGIRQGGAFELKQATWAMKQAHESPAAQTDPLVATALAGHDVRDWFTRLPWKPGHSPLARVPEYEDYLFEQWRAETFEAQWRRPGLYALGYIDRIPDVPIVLMSSWFDPYPRTVTDNYRALRDAGHRSDLQLVLGPWMHGRRSDRWSGDVDFGDDATLDGALARDYLDFRLAIFDRVFGRTRDDATDAPAVRYFRMGGGSGARRADGRLDHGGSWRTAADWPVPGTVTTSYRLGGRGTLTTTAPPPGPATLSYDADPARPVPSIGGTITSGEPVMVGGAFDQREDARFYGCAPPFLPLASRPDVLVFETPPLDEPVEVTGPIVAELWISVSTPDADLTIKLVDVHPPSAAYPDGFAMNVADGIQRLKFRDGYDAPKLLTPGDIYPVTVSCFPTSNLFAVGHRIRLDVASSNFPHFDVNPNTGAPAAEQGPRDVARVTLWLDEAHPSRLLLPVVPHSTSLTLWKDRHGGTDR